MGIEEADLIIFVGTNPRLEAPILNARVRKSWTHNELDVAVVGPEVDLSYSYDHLGESLSVLNDLISGKHAFSKRLAEAKRPMVVAGSGLFSRKDGDVAMAKIQELSQKVK